MEMKRREGWKVQGLGRAHRVWVMLLPSVLSPGVTICSRPFPPLVGAQCTKGPGQCLGFGIRSPVEVSLRKGENSSCQMP